jgi:hypothetical protein
VTANQFHGSQGDGGSGSAALDDSLKKCREPAVRSSCLPPMDDIILNQKFARTGARLTLVDRPSRLRRFVMASRVALDVRTDRKGEYFEIARRAGDEAELHVLDIQPADRHLLLLVRDCNQKQKFLCGHDERHWFVGRRKEPRTRRKSNRLT